MWTSRDRMASLFIGDLHPRVSESLLLETFLPFGPIHSVRVCRDRVTWCPLGYGYVNFVNIADAEPAMDTMIFRELMGRPMRIMFSQRDSTLRQTGIGNICIKGLAKNITSVNLFDTFCAFGKVLSCKVVCDESGSKGYGFVHFATFESAEKAVKTLDGMLFDDHPVSISHYRPFEERQAARNASPGNAQQQHRSCYPGVSLYVSNLPYNFDDQQLHTVFSPFGTVISAKVMTEAGRSKGFGFVSFSSLEAATTAVSVMNGRTVGSRALRVAFSHCNKEKAKPGNVDCSSDPRPVLRSDQADPLAGQFSTAVTETPHRDDLQLALLPRTQQTAVGVLPQGECLRPLISVVLLEAVISELPRVMISASPLGYRVNEVEFEFDLSQTTEAVGHPRRQLALPEPSPSSPDQDVLNDSSDFQNDGRTIQTSAVRPQTSGQTRPVSPEVLRNMASLRMASHTLHIVPDEDDDRGTVAPVRAVPQQLGDSRAQSPSMWRVWFWMTLGSCLRSRSLSCPTSWTLINLHSACRSYKRSCDRSV